MVRTNTHRDIPGYIESLDRRLKSVEGSAMGPQTLGEKSEMRKPAAPTDFTAIPILVFDSTGGTISSIACQWKSVHFSNGYEESFYTNIEIKTYEVWARQIDSLDDDTWSMVSTVEQPLFFPNLDDTITPVDVFATFNVIGGGVRYEVRVTAIGKDYNNYGDWSQVVPVTSVNDLTAPPVPSPPLVDIQADLAVVSWNGLPTMPVDFRYCEVGYTEFAGLDPTITGRIYSPDDVVFIAPAYSQDTFYYLRSVDFSGNTSAWCTPTSVNIPAPASGVSESAVKDWIEEAQEETQTAINNIAQEAALASQKAQEAKDAADIAIVESKDFYALSSSEDTPPTSGWTDTPPLRGDNQFIWIKTQVTYGNNSVGEGDPVLITGNTGNGLRSTTISYAKSVSGVTPPSTGWGSSIPSLSDSEYLWTRTILEYSNSTTSTSYSVSRNGTNGSSGSDGRGIVSSTVTYQLSNSGTTAPTGAWQSSPQLQTAALPFLWTRTVIVYTSGSDTVTYSVAKLGEQGPKGVPGAAGTTYYTWIKYADTAAGAGMSDSPDGKTYIGLATNKTSSTESSNAADYVWSLFKGSDGVNGTDGTTTYTWVKYADSAAGAGISNDPTGKTYIGLAYNKTTATESNTPGDYTWSLIKGSDGVGITSSAVTYQKSSSGTTTPTSTWTGTVPALNPGEYLWTQTVTTYSNSTTSTSYSVSRNGTNGSSGKGILSSTIHYQLGASGVTPPTGTWVINPPVQTPALPFLWTRTVFNYTDSTSSTTYSISKLGESGVGVSSITPFYLIKNSTESAPTKPTTNPPPAPWQETEPEYEIRTALYRTDRILYTNGDFTYTAVTRVESYTAATIAISAANMVEQAMQGLIRMSDTEPEDPTVGTIWFQLDAETSDIIGIKLYNGEDWISYALLADQVLVPSSVGGISIGEGQITTPNIAARAIIAELIAAGAIEAEHLSIGSVTKEALDSAVNKTLEEAAEWAKRTILEPGKITITNGGASATQMVLTPTRLSFVVRGTEVASIDSLSQEMNIKKAVIGESLKTGNHIIEKYTDEITIIRWVG